MLGKDEIKSYIGTYKFVALMAIGILLVVIELFQARTIYDLRQLTQHNRDSIYELSENYNKLTLKVEANNSAVNSRIDIVDSAVKIDEKRMMLVKQIRNAILENTTTKLDVRTLNRIAMSVIDYSYQYNLSMSKVLAQMKQESNFNVKAQSPAGAIGLMQIMPDTYKYISLKMGRPGLNPWDIEDNIHMGCFYMAEQLAEFGTFEDALRAYNSGPNMVKKVNAKIVADYWPETQKYVPIILDYVVLFKKYGLD